MCLACIVYLAVPKTAQLYVTGVALLYVEEYAEYFSRSGGHHGESQLDQDTVLIRRYLYVCDLYPGIATGYALDFAFDIFLGAFDLVFKQEIPYAAAICRSSRQLTLADVEGIQEITLDEIKPGEREFFLPAYGAESNERGHAVFTPVRRC